MDIRVHSYESLGTFDGPGLRLVVFLQGCNFRCLYCANPDTIDPKGESKVTDIEDIVRMAMNEKPFFGKRGGVTFSGGEPTFQAKALVPLVKRLHEQSIHVCLDTNGSIWNSDVEELLSIVDLVMLDVKQVNPERHKTLTERSNEQTLKTAKWLQVQGCTSAQCLPLAYSFFAVNSYLPPSDFVFVLRFCYFTARYAGTRHPSFARPLRALFCTCAGCRG
ncbi:MAG: 4Fe-4S cluster-binding domain-containing protein [Bacteroidaceae bacterium]|nr:4Fe-4S cluster-binding domain-containing protein [Bacteroidaceae bacterium]